MLELKKLGLPSSYLPNLPLVPEPKTPSLRKNPTTTFLVPTRRTGDQLTGPEGAVVGGVVAALVQLDHFVRRACDLGFFKNKIKLEINNLVTFSDKVLALVASQYNSSEGDAANRLSGVLGQSAELLFNLSPRQVQSALQHMHNMAQLNMDYVPVPVASKGLLSSTDGWRLVAVESPYAGDVEENLRYLRACLRDCLSRRETPVAAHGLLTQPGVVNEDDPAEQQLATEAGQVWAQYAQATVVYTDLGLTPSMREAIARAENEGRDVEYRKLSEWLVESGEGEVVEWVDPPALTGTVTGDLLVEKAPE